MFFIARITAVKIEDGEPNIFGVPDWMQSIFSTGLLGAVIVAVVASVSWRLLASAFPIVFFKNPLAFVFLRFCLLLEMTGILHGAWVIAFIIKKVTGVQRDEVYIGTADERAAKFMKDDTHINDGRALVAVLDVGEEPPVQSFDNEEEEVVEKKPDAEEAGCFSDSFPIPCN